MEPVTQLPPKPRQDFSVGNMVKIGTAYYRVVAQRPQEQGAPIYDLVSPDMERRYEWQPHRGLRVVGGKPKRVRNRKRKGRSAQAAPPQPQVIQRMSLWTRVRRAFSRH